MFALSDADLQLKILGCADGPASFNAEASRLGHSVISIDPLYRFDARTIRDRIAVTYDKMLEQARRNSQQFVWAAIQSVDELGFIRMRVMQAFLDDYDLGKRQGRYVDAELPSIAFPDKSFDLVLCSHFLFLYTEHLSEPFHRSAILELCRVGREVRIFPLLALDGRISPYVASVVEHLGDSYEISIQTVPYEFQRGGNKMMRLRPLSCSVGLLEDDVQGVAYAGRAPCGDITHQERHQHEDDGDSRESHRIGRSNAIDHR